ncbi:MULTISPECIES: efflux RND transporter periplasmic adaptor subunit [Hungatella]|uniref:HlyD family efflux transporter periplasmic adaptor subunit n=1 Tax=Hungatella hathewayi TaxID=154046 RepID=A0AAW9WK72_9FIRM|nr:MULTISPECIES: efflux RND transporter periplasmic adaptor subunit [Hungatella]MCQ4829471.1 efflux RND transporter periplasmic adaptor subunit [Hungatella sp. SL.1.14]MUB65377.1 HlyD family efflux transporter periplasmic adaptor subunit [Hungatella hathewayi]CUP61338.1 secretion protein HlyD family protein [Hungatella hathewayi]
MKNRKKKKTVIIAAAAFVLLAAAGTAALRSSGRSAGTGKGTAVMTAPVTRQDISSRLSSSGVLKPRNSYHVSSLAEGEITSADFEVGDQVEKGQVLYRIDVSSMEEEMKAAQNSAERAARNLEEAQKDYSRAQGWFNDGIFRSGDSGYIKKIYIKAGETVSSGTKIADIEDDSIMRLKVPFLSAEAAAIGTGSTALVTLSSTGEQIPGTVTAVSSKDETLTGGRIVRYVTIEAANPGGLTTEQSAAASVGDYSSSLEGTFSPVVETILSADLPDSVTVEQLLVSEGDYAAKGAPIFRFDRESADKLMRSFREKLDSAKDAMDSANSKIESTKSSMNNYTITAPISGTVIRKNMKAGDKITSKGSGDGVMAVIYDLSSITFSMSIDELDISKVKTGQTVQITAEAAGDASFRGIVENVSLESANNNGITTYPVSVTVKDPKGLLPGMNVNGKILLEESKNALVIPAASLMRGNVVYVKDPSVKAAQGEVPAGFREVTVETGIMNDEQVEVTSGLAEGDEVYLVPGAESTAGSENMGEGMTMDL